SDDDVHLHAARSTEGPRHGIRRQMRRRRRLRRVLQRPQGFSLALRLARRISRARAHRRTSRSRAPARPRADVERLATMLTERGSGMDDVVLTVESAFAEVRLYRPAKRNALSMQMLDKMVELQERLRTLDIRGVLLTAEGPAFCAGHDFASMAGATVEAIQ